MKSVYAYFYAFVGNIIGDRIEYRDDCLQRGLFQIILRCCSFMQIEFFFPGGLELIMQLVEPTAPLGLLKNCTWCIRSVFTIKRIGI
jgi:hypothetical protein